MCCHLSNVLISGHHRCCPGTTVCRLRWHYPRKLNSKVVIFYSSEIDLRITPELRAAALPLPVQERAKHRKHGHVGLPKEDGCCEVPGRALCFDSDATLCPSEHLISEAAVLRRSHGYRVISSPSQCQQTGSGSGVAVTCDWKCDSLPTQGSSLRLLRMSVSPAPSWLSEHMWTITWASDFLVLTSNMTA